MPDTPQIQFGPRDSKETIEEGLIFAPKFDEHGLIPCMTIDADTGAPLMLAYMNAESLRMTIEIGEAVYYSRSRKELWHKGRTSGEFQKVLEMRTDCDQDAIVLKVQQMGGGCCHTRRKSCFYRIVPVGDTMEGPLVMAKDD
ncbi:MAG: phosphoribosyl-AMP cyclohydrolase [Verrucomicrobiaceae bacterium]|nr:phosphoribosyl-AMP cyclohydrolase [Verrucomicrobiaceae bacterium]